MISKLWQLSISQELPLSLFSLFLRLISQLPRALLAPFRVFPALLASIGLEFWLSRLSAQLFSYLVLLVELKLGPIVLKFCFWHPGPPVLLWQLFHLQDVASQLLTQHVQ